MSDQNWTPGYMNMDDTPIVISDKEQDFGPFEGGGYGKFVPPAYFRMNAYVAENALGLRNNMRADYNSKLNNLPAQVLSELSNNGATASLTVAPTDLAIIQRDKYIIGRMVKLKTTSMQKSLAEANSFYGIDPHNK